MTTTTTADKKTAKCFIYPLYRIDEFKKKFKHRLQVFYVLCLFAFACASENRKQQQTNEKFRQI